MAKVIKKSLTERLFNEQMKMNKIKWRVKGDICDGYRPPLLFIHLIVIAATA